jgi:WD40 repeat protein
MLQLLDFPGRSRTIIVTAHDALCVRVVFSRDGRRLASASLGGEVALWEAATRLTLARLKQDRPVDGLAFNPTGIRLATACADEVIRLWDVVRADVVAELRGHEDDVHAMAFGSDGPRLVSGSGYTTVRVGDNRGGADR